MKARVYWIFLATSLAPMAVFAQSLNPSNGSIGGGSFVPVSTDDQAGTIYSLSGNVCICDVKQTSAAACFNETAGSMYFLGNGCDLTFKDIDILAIKDVVTTALQSISVNATLMGCKSLNVANASQGALIASGNVNLLNNSNIIFEGCSGANQFASASKVGGGAVLCRGCAISGAKDTVSFIANSSSGFGGAICALVASSSTQDSGICIEENRDVLFASNTSTSNGGGAIFSAIDTRLDGNQKLVFRNNIAKAGATTSPQAPDGCGGAIACKNSRTGVNSERLLTLQNNKSVLFEGNKADVQGGAIFTQNLMLIADGDVNFINNSVLAANNGGAIYATPKAVANRTQEMTIAANKGNVIFDGNKAGTTRNSLSVDSTANIPLALRAKQGYGIYFYDPVVSSSANAAIKLNEADASGQYSGTIVFSGEKLTTDEKVNQANKQSTFSGDLTLSAGALQLKSGALVQAKTIKQEPNSTLIMDVGTGLEATGTVTGGAAPTGGEVTLQTLSINTDSLADASMTDSVNILAPNNIVLSDVNFVSEETAGYGAPVFGETTTFDLITVSPSGNPAPAQTTVKLPTEDIEVTPEEHYGYQGTWSMPKVTPPQNLNAPVTLKATWNFLDVYAPDPERQGALIPNSLWGAFADIRVVQDVMKRAPSHETARQGLWGAGIGSFLHKSSSKTARQFSHNSGGYLLGFTAKPMFDDLFSLGFYQMFARDKDYLVTKNRATVIGGALYYQHGLSPDIGTKLLNAMGALEPFVMHVQFAFNHASNKEKTTVTKNVAPGLDSPKELEGEWGNDCFNIEVGTFTTMEVRNVYLQKIFDYCHPFVNVNLVYAHQGDFEETGAPKGRSFESSSLTNVSVPLGVMLESGAADENGFTVELTYTPDLYRENPKVKVFSLDDKKSAHWETKASNLARQALSASIGQHVIATPNLEIFANGGFEIRGSSRAYNVDVRGQYKF